MKERGFRLSSVSRDPLSCRPLACPSAQRAFPLFSTPRLLPLGQLTALIAKAAWNRCKDWLRKNAAAPLPSAITPDPTFGVFYAPQTAGALQSDTMQSCAVQRDRNLTSLARELDHIGPARRPNTGRGLEVSALELSFYEQLLQRFASESDSL